MDIFEFNSKYRKNRLDIIKQRDILKEEYKLLIPEANKKVISEFVNENSYTLCKFANCYGLHESGPFEKFITTYYKVNGNLDIFLEKPDHLNVIAKALDAEIINIEQLKDVCVEEDRILIIYNESFWKVLFEQGDYPWIDDFNWIIKIENTCSKYYSEYKKGREDIFDNARINNAIIRTLKENVGTSDDEDSLNYNCHITMSYIFWFTTLIHSLFIKEISEEEFANSVKEGLKTFSLTKSKGFLDFDKIELSTTEVNQKDSVEKSRRGF